MSCRLIALGLTASSLAILPAIGETRTYDVSAFDGIDVSAGIQVIYETGVPASVSVENDKGDFSDIIVETDDGHLVLKRPRKLGWNRKRAPYTVTVGVGTLSYLEASSGSDVTGNGLSGEEASVDVSSGASVSITGVSAGDVNAEASSGSSIDLSGTCSTIDADASSGAELDAGGLICQHLVADVSSGASIRAHASDSVDAEASSGGSVKVSGGATNVTIDKSSGGSVSVTG